MEKEKKQTKTTKKKKTGHSIQLVRPAIIEGIYYTPGQGPLIVSDKVYRELKKLGY